MNIHKLIPILFFAVASVGISCTKNFEDINTDPNRIDQISPGTLLNPTIYGMAGYNMLQYDDITSNLMQGFASVSQAYPAVCTGMNSQKILVTAVGIIVTNG